MLHDDVSREWPLFLLVCQCSARTRGGQVSPPFRALCPPYSLEGLKWGLGALRELCSKIPKISPENCKRAFRNCSISVVFPQAPITGFCGTKFSQTLSFQCEHQILHTAYCHDSHRAREKTVPWGPWGLDPQALEMRGRWT